MNGERPHAPSLLQEALQLAPFLEENNPIVLQEEEKSNSKKEANRLFSVLQETVRQRFTDFVRGIEIVCPIDTDNPPAVTAVLKNALSKQGILHNVSVSTRMNPEGGYELVAQYQAQGKTEAADHQPEEPQEVPQKEPESNVVGGETVPTVEEEAPIEVQKILDELDSLRGLNHVIQTRRDEEQQVELISTLYNSLNENKNLRNFTVDTTLSESTLHFLILRIEKATHNALSCSYANGILTISVHRPKSSSEVIFDDTRTLPTRRELAANADEQIQALINQYPEGWPQNEKGSSVPPVNVVNISLAFLEGRLDEQDLRDKGYPPAFIAALETI